MLSTILSSSDKRAFYERVVRISERIVVVKAKSYEKVGVHANRIFIP